MQGAVTLAVQAVLVGPLDVVLRLDRRGLVELWILPQQGKGLFRPGLVAQEIDMGDQLDAVGLAGRDDTFDVLPGEGIRVAKFRMGS